MKILIDKFKYFGVVLALLITASCNDELMQKYDSVDVIGAPIMEFTIPNVGDSTFTINYTFNAAGWLSVAVLEGTDNAVPTQDQMKFKKVTGAQSFHFEVEAEALTATLKISNLKQNAEYEVFAMATSVDGVSGEVQSASVQTSDTYKPLLSSTSPGVSNVADKAPNFSVNLNFNEPVLVDKAASIYFRYLNIVTMETTDHPADVTVSGNVVTAKQTYTPIPGQYVFLTVLNDAIKDRAGNFYDGIQSGLTEAGTLGGLFWRIAFAPHAYVSVLPTLGVAVQDLNFNIELTYGLTMDFKRGTANAVVYTPSDIVISYKAGATTINTDVPAANIAFDGTKVTITPPRTPVYGETVSIAIKENAFRTRFGSPVAAVEAGQLSWLISYGYARTLILGDYVMGNLVSNWDGAIDDEFTLNITAHATDANKVLINGLLGSTTPIEGTFNGDFARLTIAGGQLLSLGAPYPGYYIEIWNGYRAGGITDAFILADGTITFTHPNGFGFYWYTEDFSSEGWDDLYSSATWTKARKASVQPNYVLKLRDTKEKLVK